MSSFDYCAAHAYPSSTLVKGLDVSRWMTSIKDKYFDRKKGKGLVTKVAISGGQVVWKEAFGHSTGVVSLNTRPLAHFTS